jgi:hypothetical protein
MVLLDIKDKYDDLATSLIITIPTLGRVSFAMFINPESLDWNLGDKRQQVDEPWEGNFESNFPSDYEILSITGTTGAFIHKDEGILFSNREDSVAYQKYQALVEIIENNGMEYNSKGRPLDVSPVLITYLGGSWKGNFRSFSSTESETDPLRFSIEFEFQAEASQVLT